MVSMKCGFFRTKRSPPNRLRLGWSAPVELTRRSSTCSARGSFATNAHWRWGMETGLTFLLKRVAWSSIYWPIPCSNRNPNPAAKRKPIETCKRLNAHSNAIRRHSTLDEPPLPPPPVPKADSHRDRRRRIVDINRLRIHRRGRVDALRQALGRGLHLGDDG